MIFSLILLVYSLYIGSLASESANPSWVRLAEVQVLHMSSPMSSAMGGELITNTTASQFYRCFKLSDFQVKFLHEVTYGLVAERLRALYQATKLCNLMPARR